MKLAILGAGSVGSTLGRAWAKQGHTVIFGVRDVKAPKLQTLLTEIGANAQAASLTEAAAQAEVIVLTVTWDAMPEVVAAVGDLKGKVLLDCTNPLIGNQLDAALNSAQSGGEQVAAWFPARCKSRESSQPNRLGNNGKSPIWDGDCHDVLCWR